MKSEELVQQKTSGYMLLTVNDYLLEHKIISEEEKRMMEQFIIKKHNLLRNDSG